MPTIPTKRAERLGLLLRQAAADEMPVRAAVNEQIDTVRPRGRRHVDLFCLLFFGTPYQDLSAFVVRDLGHVRYERYRLERSARRFGDRQAVDHALALEHARAVISRALGEGDLDAAVHEAVALGQPRQAWHPLVIRRAHRLINRVARELERAGRQRRALALYRTSDAPPARERRVRLLARLGRERDALTLLESMTASPLDEQERVFAPWFADRLKRRLARKLGARPPRSPRRRRLERRVISLERPGDPAVANQAVTHGTVERMALEALGGRGFLAENWLWRSLFGLAFWDIVFAPVAGAFEQPFQLGPLDLHQPGFRDARRTLVDQRLAWLRATPWLEMPLLAVYDAKQGLANALVSWHPGARQALTLALGRLRGGHLALVLDRMSRDLGRYRRGLPDLFVVTDRWPGYALYEVKAPGDQVRAEQRTWLDFFADSPIPANVIDVAWR